MTNHTLIATGMVASLALVSANACTSDTCEGAACDAKNGAGGSGGSGGGECRPYVDINACEVDQSCPSPESVSLGLQAVQSIQTDEMANPEIVGFVPGSNKRALVISAIANQLAELVYTDGSLAFGRKSKIETGSDTSVTSSVSVAPSGEYAAVTVAEVDCGVGRIMFVDVTDSDSFGTVLGSVEVGFNPDSGAFSADGRYYVSADEDDREDRPCKPDTRFGGTVTVVDMGDGPDAPSVAQTIDVDHAMDSEPEGVAVAPDGTVLVTIQETSEVGVFSLGDVPNATMQIIALPADSEPDGVAVNGDGKWAAITLERIDTLIVFDIAARAVAAEYLVTGSGDVPDEYNRDEGKVTKVHEPEQVTFLRSQGALFTLFALQESHSAIAYRIQDDGTPVFDSIAPVGVDWQAEMDGREKSDIGPEGLAAHGGSGLVLTANEREGSITLLKTASTAAQACD